MERRKVNSGTLRAVGYEANSQMLEIEFRDGAVYRYSPVPPSIHDKLMRAPSIGSYFDDNIRDEYTSHRLR